MRRKSLSYSFSSASTAVSASLAQTDVYTVQGKTVYVDSRYGEPQFVAEGGYGRVYRARDTLTGEEVALKYLRILANDHASDWDNSVRILREVHFLLTLRGQRYICPLLDAFPVPQSQSQSQAQSHGKFTHFCLVFPFFGTQTESGNFSLPEIAQVALKLLLGLRQVHGSGLLFRDVKRDNLFVSDAISGQQPGNLHVVLGDFGLARQKTRKMTSEVQTTPYRDASLILGASEYGEETDAFAAGCVVLELLTGEQHGIFATELIGNSNNQIAAQLALVAPKSGNFEKLATLATRSFLEEMQQRAASDEKIRDFAVQRWTNLQRRLAEDFARPELFPIAKQLVEGLLAVEPGERISVEDAISHEFFRKVGLSAELLHECDVGKTEISRNLGNFAAEDFQTETENAGVTCEARAAFVKRKLWTLLRGVREVFETPFEQMFPGEFPIAAAAQPVQDEYELRLTSTSSRSDEYEPVAKRTRLARKSSGVNLPL